jgi:hypothetical protein
MPKKIAPKVLKTFVQMVEKVSLRSTKGPFVYIPFQQLEHFIIHVSIKDKKKENLLCKFNYFLIGSN